MCRFVLVALVGLFFSGCVDVDAIRKSYAERDVVEKVGVLAHLDISWPNSTAAFRRALACFRAEGVAAVIVLGDPTKDGYANQRQVFEAAWNEAFRGTTAPRLVLAQDPHAYAGVRFTGFGRYPLTDLLCVQPLDGKTVNAGSMRGFEVSKIFDEQDAQTAGQMRASAQGLLVLRRQEGMIVRRLDFSEKVPEEVGPPWEIDGAGLIRCDEGKAAPEFWADTTVSVVRGYDKVGNAIYTVRWPPVLAKYTGARAFSYDVRVGDDVIRRVQTKSFHRSEAHEVGSVACRIAEAELKGRPPRFGVTPVSSLGQEGKTVWSRDAR